MIYRTIPRVVIAVQCTQANAAEVRAIIESTGGRITMVYGDDGEYQVHFRPGNPHDGGFCFTDWWLCNIDGRLLTFGQSEFELLFTEK